jgi:sulfatase maturation enzyme AslB (radical SAM superfamily)
MGGFRDRRRAEGKAAGGGSYDLLMRNLERARAACGENVCPPLPTITRAALPHLPEIVDEYVRLGFNGIFLRPVSPFGRALEKWDALSCKPEEFVEAYENALDHIIKLNESGVYFAEFYTTLLLSRILTPFSTGFVDLQSPSGAGISGVIYDCDGNVFPSDEGRMLARRGDMRFLLGNVNENSYEEIFNGGTLRALIGKSCVDTLPGCSSCAYNLYCGADPIRYYAESGDVIGFRPGSAFCRKNKGLLDHLFSLIREDNPTTTDIFWSWMTHRRLKDVQV